MRAEPRCSATLAPGMSKPGLPYLYSGDMEAGLRSIREIGYDIVELLMPGTDLMSAPQLADCLARHHLDLAAIGTGGAYIKDKLHLCSPNEVIRRRAEEYIIRIIDLAAPFGAAVILGLVTGYLEPEVSREDALGWLAPSLQRLAGHAVGSGVTIVIEPLNRYESNLINRLEHGLELLDLVRAEGVKLLADLFHMNIEEADIAGTMRGAGEAIGHVHFVDSNRQAPGMGHTCFEPVVEALRDIGYRGCLSVEALPLPDAQTAAKTALDTYRRLTDK